MWKHWSTGAGAAWWTKIRGRASRVTTVSVSERGQLWSRGLQCDLAVCMCIRECPLTYNALHPRCSSSSHPKCH